MVFPNGGPIPRHPSQLYEAFAEGLLLFLLLWFMAHYTRAPQRPGLIAGTFLTGYGIARATVEFFRQPDQQLGFLYSWVTMGQLLSLPLIIAGLMLIWYALSRPPLLAQPVPARP
jgi:phosphatidylglycerol:prolipoprotein diacylglycerol transferase